MTQNVNKKYKDRLFKKIFGTEENKDNILSLYNALNSSNYTNPDDIKINTIEGFLYLGMKNDVSFLIDDHMILWEQQSTFNPNMPFRGLMYFGKLYESFVVTHGLERKLYQSTIIKIPTPKFVVFYTGDKDKDSAIKLRLSDAFIHADKSGDFEWTATMYNLNADKNDELLSKCKPLADYMTLINYVRAFKAQGMTMEDAVDAAVERCIKENILREFLLKHRSEVEGMLFTEFDEKAYAEAMREDGKLEIILDLVSSGMLKLEDAITKSNLTEAEFNQALEEYRKNAQ